MTGTRSHRFERSTASTTRSRAYLLRRAEPEVAGDRSETFLAAWRASRSCLPTAAVAARDGTADAREPASFGQSPRQVCAAGSSSAPSRRCPSRMRSMRPQSARRCSRRRSTLARKPLPTNVSSCVSGCGVRATEATHTAIACVRAGGPAACSARRSRRPSGSPGSTPGGGSSWTTTETAATRSRGTSVTMTTKAAIRASTRPRIRAQLREHVEQGRLRVAGKATVRGRTAYRLVARADPDAKPDEDFGTVTYFVDARTYLRSRSGSEAALTSAMCRVAGGSASSSASSTSATKPCRSPTRTRSSSRRAAAAGRDHAVKPLEALALSLLECQRSALSPESAKIAKFSTEVCP